MVVSSMLKSVNGKRGFWCEVSSLKSVNKTPGTYEGVEVMPRILRQDFLLLQGKGCSTPAIPITESPRGFLPHWSAVLYRKDEETGLQLQGDRGHREIAATGTPRAPRTPARPSSRTCPHLRSRMPRVLSTRAHGRSAHAQPRGA